VAKEDDLIPDLEGFTLPPGDLDSALAEGMPDPTDRPEEPPPGEGQPEGRKSKKGKKKEKRMKRVVESKSEEGPSKKANLVVGISAASPYTVLLAISLAAILIAIVYMAVQLANYGGDYGAKGAKQTVLAPAAARFIEPAHSNVV